MNLDCHLMRQLKKTKLTRAEQISVLTLVATGVRALQAEMEESLNPVAYRQLVADGNALLRVIAPNPRHN